MRTCIAKTVAEVTNNTFHIKCDKQYFSYKIYHIYIYIYIINVSPKIEIKYQYKIINTADNNVKIINVGPILNTGQAI